MMYRRLGRTGLMVSEIGLGGHEYRRRSLAKEGRFTVLDPDRPAIIDAALTAGVNYFDTTFTEEAQSLGAALNAVHAKREEIFISGMSIDMLRRLKDVEPSRWRRYAETEVTERLELLRTDYLDVFQVCAMDNGFSAERLEGAMDALRQLKAKGLIRHIGASSHDPGLLARIIEEQDPFDVAMTRVNYCAPPNDALMRALRGRDVGFVAFKPFVWFEYGVPFFPVCRRIIERRGAAVPTPAQMALRWILQWKEVAAVIPAANTRGELLENVDAFRLEMADVDTGFLDECRSVPDRTVQLAELLDHPHEEVRTFAHDALRDAVGEDFGTDREKYVAALGRRSPPG